MQSLGADARNFEVAADAARVRQSASRSLVLPRFLRRPMRALRRLEVKLPRAFGAKAMIALFAVTAIAGTIIGGHGMTVVSAVTAWSGFSIENVRITGQSETSEVNVLDALALGAFPSLLTLDLETAKARVESLPWVKEATLKKLFPDTLEIAIVERDPYALWQHDETLSLIDDAGKIITDDIGERYALFPQVIGPGAADKVADYTALVASVPEVGRRARAGVLVSRSRWTVVLDNGIELMLPADKPEAALANIATLDRNEGLLSREVSAIDLRQPGQLIVRLTADGLVARKAALTERAKIARRGRTNI